MGAWGPERDRSVRLLADLGVTGPADLTDLARRLGERRGRPITVLRAPDLGEPSGLWVALDDVDIVIWDAGLSGHWRRQAVAHELGHIAFDHGRELAADEGLLATLLPDLDLSRVRMVLERGAYSEAEEREAEVFASVLLQLPEGGIAASLPDAVRDQARGMAATFGSRRDESL